MGRVRRKRRAPAVCPKCAVPLVKSICPKCGYKKPVKRRSIKCELDGYKFDSQTEMRYYHDVLKPLLAVGEIVRMERPAPRLYLDIGDRRVGWYTGDFLLVNPDGSETIVETKGRAEPDFRYRWLLVQVLYGNRYTFEFVGKDEPQFIRRAAVKKRRTA